MVASITWPRRIIVWTVALAVIVSPLVLIGMTLNRSFDPELQLVEKTIVAVAALVAIVISSSKDLLSEHKEEVKACVGWMTISLFLLLFVGLLKIVLYEAWKGGFSNDFSSGFDLAVASFSAAGHKPASWLRYILFIGISTAYAAFFRGAIMYLVLLLPGFQRYGRLFK